MFKQMTSRAVKRFSAGSPWRVMAPLAGVHLLMVASAALGLHAIAREVDRSDTLRASEAVTAAFSYQLSRLEMVTLNNAVYTEAWKAVGGTEVDEAWAQENWTVAPPDLPGHHGIVLLEADGTPIVGTRAGRPLPRPALVELATLVQPVLRKVPTEGAGSARAIINTGPVPLMVAAANVIPEPDSQSLELLRGPKRRLVLVHPINAKLLATMNETIGGEQLKLGKAGEIESRVVFPAGAGEGVSMSWRSRKPGQDAMFRSLRIVGPILLLVTFLLVLAMRAGVASSRALRRAATTDQLTDLPNRAAFSAELEHRAAQNRTFTLGLIDLDGFKGVNDEHGHPAGDALLKSFGQVLARAAGTGDLVARLGGDEFAFICDTREAADELAMRLRTGLQTPLSVGSFSVPVGASIGVASAGADVFPEAVMAFADANLYADKRHRKAEQGNVVRALQQELMRAAANR